MTRTIPKSKLELMKHDYRTICLKGQNGKLGHKEYSSMRGLNVFNDSMCHILIYK